MSVDADEVSKTLCEWREAQLAREAHWDAYDRAGGFTRVSNDWLVVDGVSLNARADRLAKRLEELADRIIEEAKIDEESKKGEGP